MGNTTARSLIFNTTFTTPADPGVSAAFDPPVITALAISETHFAINLGPLFFHNYYLIIYYLVGEMSIMTFLYKLPVNSKLDQPLLGPEMYTRLVRLVCIKCIF